jgi:hypothetical protein
MITAVGNPSSAPPERIKPPSGPYSWTFSGTLDPDPAVYGIVVCAVKLLGVSRVANIDKEGSGFGFCYVAMSMYGG